MQDFSFDVEESEAAEQARAEVVSETTQVAHARNLLPSTDSVKKEIQAFDADIRAVAERVKNTEVVDQASAEAIIDTGNQAKDIMKQIEGAVKIRIGHVKQLVQNINKIVKYYKDQLEDIQTQAKQKYEAWQRTEYIRQQEAERTRQKAIDDANRKLLAEAKRKHVEPPPPIEAPPVEKAQAVHRTSSGSKASVAKVWTFEVEDLEKVPRGLFVLDEQLVNDQIRGGVREIEGLRIYQKDQIRF